MSWVDLLVEKPTKFVGEDMEYNGTTFSLEGMASNKFKAEPAISCDDRDQGRTVFVTMNLRSIYISPDEATAMGMALIKAAQQERNR